MEIATSLIEMCDSNITHSNVWRDEFLTHIYAYTITITITLGLADTAAADVPKVLCVCGMNEVRCIYR